MRGVAAFAVVCGLTGPNPQASPDTPFEHARPGEVVVRVRVNGLGPFAFLLDTGSSHSAVSEELARAVGAPAVARTVVTTPIGEEVRPVVRLETVQLGRVATSPVLASLVRGDTLDRAGIIQGLIGQDVLKDRRYTLDFLHRRVAWHDGLSVPARGCGLPLRWVRERFQLELAQGDRTLRFVPDSAAHGLVLFHDRRPVRLPIEFDRRRSDLSTLGHRTRVRHGRLRELRLCSVTLRDAAAVVVERGDAAHGEEDGLLPMHLFDTVTFDGPGRTLHVLLSAVRPFPLVNRP
jgi:hypothetical protein